MFSIRVPFLKLLYRITHCTIHNLLITNYNKKRVSQKFETPSFLFNGLIVNKLVDKYLYKYLIVCKI